MESHRFNLAALKVELSAHNILERAVFTLIQWFNMATSLEGLINDYLMADDLWGH